ncbi:hypothetical protein HDU96_009685 [Phlyctochytrium bullatum]|nr:hypothetical protein HDU96_009685 [Phlyctochytrium bullatum]
MATSNPTLAEQCATLSRLFPPRVMSTSLTCCTRTGVTCSSSDVTGMLTFIVQNISNFANMNLTGFFPSDVTLLPQLTSLVLANNTFTRSPFPANLSSLQNLEVLDLEEAKFTGSITALPPKLKKLNLAYSGVSGTLPENLPSSLEEVNLSGNTFLVSGTRPPALSDLSSLKVFDVAGCRLNGSLPELPKSIVKFDALMNWFTGPIPASYSSLPSLQYLDLDSNQLNGSLPASLPSTMVLFSVNSNNFTGGLPNYSNLTNLRYLDVMDNSLSGKLPDWTYTLMRRRNLTFYVSDNCFTEVDESRLTWSYSANDFYSTSKCGPLPSGVSRTTGGGSGSSQSFGDGFEERLVDKLAFKIGVSVGGFVLLLIIAMIWNCFKKKDEEEDKQDVEAVQVAGAGKTENTPLPVYTPASEVPPRPEAGTATQPNKTFVGTSPTTTSSRSIGDRIEDHLVDKLAFKVGIAVGGFVLLLIVATIWNCFKGKGGDEEDKLDVENAQGGAVAGEKKASEMSAAGTATQANKAYV